jgi:hypothetical protein
MAIAQGAGTEIIRSHLFNACGLSGDRTLITGVQHHIYTVLSVSCFCVARSGTEFGYLNVVGYDSREGATGLDIQLAKLDNSAGETFVWNDKFSFNGYEPIDFTANLDDDGTKQIAIAAQGSGVDQYLKWQTDSTGTYYDIVVTFIDQNNS